MNVRRRASVALISSCVYELSAGKVCLESLVDAGKSDAVVLSRSETGAGEAGSLTSEGDADSKGTIGSMESSGDVKEVHVVKSSGYTPLSVDPDGGNTNGRRFLGTRISKISGAITCIHNAVRLLRIFSIRGSSLRILCTESGPLEA